MSATTGTFSASYFPFHFHTNSPSELSIIWLTEIRRSYSTLWSPSTYCKPPKIPLSIFFSHHSAYLWFLVYIHDNVKTCPVVLFTPHIAERRCAVRSFLPHPFHIELMFTNDDNSPPQHHPPRKPPSSFASPRLSTALLLSYRSRHPPSPYQPRLMAVHSKPSQAKGVLPPWDTSRSAVPLARANNITSPEDISDPFHRLGHTGTPPERRIGGSEVHEQAPQLASRR